MPGQNPFDPDDPTNHDLFSRSHRTGSLFARSVEEWVNNFALKFHVMDAKAIWCNNWAQHIEPPFVLEGLWRAYEEARAADAVNAGGQATMNYFMVTFLPAMDWLTAPKGPFWNCTLQRCRGAEQSLSEKRPTRSRRRSTPRSDGPASAGHFTEVLGRRVFGQDHVVEAVSPLLAMARRGVRLRDQKPLAAMLFVGPSGCGKTEMAHAIAEAHFGSEDAVIRIDLGEYGHYSDVSRFTGSGPGYLGSDQPQGWLTTKIIEQPRVVLLLDEVEKADPKVFDALLAVLDAGRMTDGQDQTADFRQVIVVMTSNIGSEEYARNPTGFADSDSQSVNERVGAEARKYFRPEFFNRLDVCLVFNALDRPTLEMVTAREFGRSIDLLNGAGYTIDSDLERDQQVIGALTDRATSPEYGARQILRLIEQKIIAPAMEFEPGPLTLRATPADEEPVEWSRAA